MIPDLSIANKLEIIINRRNYLLELSAWTQLPDAVLTANEKMEWRIYRETLQNIEFSFVVPDDVVFPDLPIVTSTSQTAFIITAKARQA